MKKVMIRAAALSLVGFLTTLAAWLALKTPFFYTAAITFGTTFYHFAMRLAVGTAFDLVFHNNMNYNLWWFKEKSFEKKIYKVIGLKKWKNSMPTYSPESFDITKHTTTEIIMATCQAEIVHETIIVLSFVPLIFSAPLNAFWAFLITSIAAAAFDLVFVMMQRYNRPRLVRLLKREKSHM